MTEPSIVLSNVDVYFTIAKESLAESQRLIAANRTLREDGKGFVITYDPDRSSFKHSVVALVFSGIYLDALLYFVGTRQLGTAEYMKIERTHYEIKLQALGLTDRSLLEECKRFRESRNDLVHEKPLELTSGSTPTEPSRWAQEEAEHAVTFVGRVSQLLSKAPSKPATS